MKPLPSQARLRELFDYDPDTGEFYHLQDSCSCKGRVGQIAGSLNRFDKEGKPKVKSLTVDGIPYLSSRIAWKYVTGIDPIGLIDHKDLNCHNNRFENLREATHGQNQTNSLPYKGRSQKGLSFKNGKWSVKIRVDKKLIRLGRFSREEEAIAVYKEAARKFHGDFYCEAKQ